MPNNYLDGEVPMTASDGVSPIDSLNKYFFLDYEGLKRNHKDFLNFYKHSNLFDVSLPQYEYNALDKTPALYQQVYDQFGHASKLVKMPPSIKVEDTPALMAIVTTGANTRRLPSSIDSTQYNNLMNAGLLLPNVIYQISKPTSETTIEDLNGNTWSNAVNAYHEFMLTSIIFNTTTGMYDLTWEMLGGKELTVDSALSSTSMNPVANNVIYQEIGNIQAILATLTTP